ncbi:DUF4097 family beta strand repeat-containing protein [Cellulomonas edaphi]|uniref:DUF4097 family beta strand repeat-containing protein n=1 Tax=Cellulomonas edaphi TaxID=3053468 RepID=A0ABT7S3A3_9CELL|nr:DUF4097 family beta strand repeat-containing protein [Cellulomons edaphi]MDM7830091.1 DUF4097 family beta strand repeat-containing protein [Cellulomons edaphi]
MTTFETPTPIRAVLDLPGAHLRLIAAERVSTTVEVLPANAGKSRDVKAADRTEVELRDGVLRMSIPVQHRLIGPSGEVEVTIQLPAGSHVEAIGAAEVRGVGRLGDVRTTGSYRTVKLDEAADVHLDAATGDITVGRLTGAAEITTTQGDISIAEAERGSLVLRTAAGSVTVGVAAGSSATLDAGTAYGRIQNGLRNTGGTPDVQIHATTSSGDIAAHSL